MTFNPPGFGILKKAAAIGLEFLDSMAPKFGAIAIVAMIIPQNSLPTYASLAILALSTMVKLASCTFMNNVTGISE